MIALKFKNNENKSYAIPEVWVKSISAAWNQIREWRNTIPFDVLEGSILEIYEGDNPINSNRIPAQILFKANKNGKLEFKDYSKVKTREEAPKEVEKEASFTPAASVKNPNSFTMVTTRGKVDMRKIFNPIF